MNFVFHPEAEAEFNKTIDYYEEVEPELGFDFAGEVYAAIKRATSFPKAWPCIHGDIRRSLVKRFPYGVLYSEESEGINVVAIMPPASSSGLLET
jgi:plasmid stabilization system protein ParE